MTDDERIVECEPIPDGARQVFGDRIELAERYAEILTEQGVLRGLIGPSEVPRLWTRHILNSAVLAEAVDSDSVLFDIGSGAGFPGVPLAIARPDLSATLIEPLLRRTTFLDEVVEQLGLSNVRVVRGRAEEKAVLSAVGKADVVTSRAVAPLERLAGWSAPLIRIGGQLIALKGRSAAEEIERDRAAVKKVGITDLATTTVGTRVLDEPTTLLTGRRFETSKDAADARKAQRRANRKR